MSTTTPNIKDWLGAFRLRTLPLAFSCIITGSAVAFFNEKFNWLVFVLSIVTTLFLQILSNLANDYGDSEKGTDNENRIGPDRAIQSGKISSQQMKKAMYLFVVLSLMAGIPLIYFGTKGIPIIWLIGFFILGIASIVAAIKYTAGKGAYGYKGLGDLFVFLFFGIVGVSGSYFLHTQSFNWYILLPATTVGCFATAVLNLNNMRDIENDIASKKFTLATKLGKSGSKKYHFAIIIIGICSSIIFIILQNLPLKEILFLISFLPIIFHLIKVSSIKSPKQFDPELKKVALSTFLFSILFWIGFIL